MPINCFKCKKWISWKICFNSKMMKSIITGSDMFSIRVAWHLLVCFNQYNNQIPSARCLMFHFKRVHSSCEPLSSRVDSRDKCVTGPELFEGVKVGSRLSRNDSIPHTRGAIVEMLSVNICANTWEQNSMRTMRTIAKGKWGRHRKYPLKNSPVKVL